MELKNVYVYYVPCTHVRELSREKTLDRYLLLKK